MMDRARNNLVILSAVLAAGAFLGAVIIAVQDRPGSFAASPVVFGLLLLVGAWLLRSGRVTGGAVLVGLLCLLQIVLYPFLDRQNAVDWISQTVLALISVVALALSVQLLAARRRTDDGFEGRSQSGTA
jgi:hypothetical protein